MARQRQVLDTTLNVLSCQVIDKELHEDRKPIATLTLKSAASMSQPMANEVAIWLRKLATEIKSQERMRYSKRFTARFY
jgi:hypothetical protein